MLVVQPVLDGARRDRRQEGVCHARAPQRGLESGDVRLDGRLPHVLEGGGADHLALARADAGPAAARGEVLRKLLQVAAADTVGHGPLAGRELAYLEPANALAGVVREVGLA